MNKDSKSGKERGPSLVCSLGLSCLGLVVPWARRAGSIDFCLALAALVSPVQNTILLFHFISLHRPGQAGMLGRLSLCLRLEPKQFKEILHVDYLIRY